MDENHDPDDASSSEGDTKDNGGDPGHLSAEAAEPQAGSSPVAQESSSGETKTPETCSAIPTEHAGHCTAESQHLDAVAMLMDARVVDTGPALERTTIGQAICTGDPEAVSAFLDGIDSASAIRQLVGGYGGGRKIDKVGRKVDKDVLRKDDQGLFRMTVPLLHAAYTGNIAMFSTVLGAMRAKLRAQQVKRAVAARDLGCRSILTMAALSKSKDMLRDALAVLEEHLTIDEVKEVMMAGSHVGRSVLIWTAANGCKDIFEATVVALQNRLTQNEVLGLTMYEEGDHSMYRNTLVAAAASGDKDTWDAALADLEKREVELETYMKVTFSKKNGLSHTTVLRGAVQSGSVATFEAVVASMVNHLNRKERKTVMDDGIVKRPNLLLAAVASGNTRMVKAVVAALEHQYGTRKVDELAYAPSIVDANILHFAARSGSKAMFEAVFDMLEEDKVKSMMTPFSTLAGAVASVLHVAASSGSEEVFEVVLGALTTRLEPNEVEILMASAGGSGASFGYEDDRGDYGRTIMHSAAHSGSKAVVEVVLAAMKDKLEPYEVESMLSRTSRHLSRYSPSVSDSRSVLHSAAMSGSKDAFWAVLAGLQGALSSLEVKDLLLSGGDSAASAGLLRAAVDGGNIQLLQGVFFLEGRRDSFDKEEVERVLRSAATAGCADMWEAVSKGLKKLCNDLLSEWVLQRPELVVRDAMLSRDPATVRAVLRLVQQLLPAAEVSEVCGKVSAHGFASWTQLVLAGDIEAEPVVAGGLVWAIEVLSCILESPTVLDPSDLMRLSRGVSEDWLAICFLEALASVENAFVAGTTLSVALAKAAGIAPQGERRKLGSLQNKLDGLLLEILERLPQTVPGFHAGMEGCAAVFEPEVKEGDARGLLGPLWMVLQSRGHMETFCAQPLIVDYLSRRFSHGLGNLVGTKGLTSDHLELEELVHGAAHSHALGMDVHDEIYLGGYGYAVGPTYILKTLFTSPCIMLQGVNNEHASRTSLSVLPGVQFLTAGLVAVPEAYYRVPAMRMVMDVIVHLGMLAVFCSLILLHDDGPLTAGEISFAIYILAGTIAEVREMTSDFSLYAADHWNPTDLLGLSLVTGGLAVRIADETSSWGRALYALSAPLMFSRILFYAQMLRFQGPMIQVIFSMIGELVKFGIVILVVMFGFAMSFYALFRDVDTFGQTFLTLFKGMLGEVGFFDDFVAEDYREYEEVATALFIVYLVMIAVMLLNLLVAVLSTAHSKVEEKAEQEFRVSRARFIDYYRSVVDKHLLPPPFNLVQLVLSLPAFLVDRCWGGRRYIHTREAVGKMVFWLVMGALAATGGTALWWISAVYAPFKWHRFYHHGKHPFALPRNEKLSPFSIVLGYLIVFLWSIVAAPLQLVAFWLTAPLKRVGLRPWSRREPRPRRYGAKRKLHEMLKDCPGALSVGELQEFLEDPMSDPEVRQDEKNRPTTVEHIKQLRDRVENTIVKDLGTRLERVEQELARQSDQTEARLAGIEQEIAASQEKTDRKMDIILTFVEGGSQHETTRDVADKI